MTEAQTLPFMYKDMAEQDFIRWNMDYTMPIIAGLLSEIPEDQLWAIPASHIDPAGWVVACFAADEDRIVSELSQQPPSVPASLQDVSGAWCSWNSTPEAVRSLSSQVRSTDILSYWYDVRAKTHAFLMSLQESELKRPLGGDTPDCCGDPLRERFVQLMYQQNYVMGKLMTIRQLLLGSSERPAFPDWMQTGEMWKAEMKKREPKGRWL
jgi:hypothetical protein